MNDVMFPKKSQGYQKLYGHILYYLDIETFKFTGLKHLIEIDVEHFKCNTQMIPKEKGLFHFYHMLFIFFIIPSQMI
jgi:hypothetical protein